MKKILTIFIITAVLISLQSDGAFSVEDMSRGKKDSSVYTKVFDIKYASVKEIKDNIKEKKTEETQEKKSENKKEKEQCQAQEQENSTKETEKPEKNSPSSVSTATSSKKSQGYYPKTLKLSGLKWLLEKGLANTKRKCQTD